MDTDGEIQRADPEARQRARRWWLPAGGVGLGLAAALTALSHRIDGPADLPLIYSFWGILLAIGLLMLWPIRGLWLTGREAMRERHFPPPSSRVVRDTRVFRGEAAVLRGRLLQAFALALGVFVVLTPMAIGWLMFSVTLPIP